MKSKKLIAPLVVFLALTIGITLSPTTLRAFLPDQQTGTFVDGPAMSQSRAAASSTVLYDGRVLIAGGRNQAGEPLATAEIIGMSGEISSAPPMNIPRAGHAAVWLYDGYVLVTGGTTTGGGVTNTAELYDPLTDSWRLLPGTMSDPRTGHTATNLLDGRILIAGGSNGSSALSSVETFSIVDEKFSFAGAMDVARENHAAAALLDGRVLLVGGKNAEGLTLATTQIFNAETNSIDLGPALNEARQDATATTLLDGTVLVAGGRNPQLPKNGVSELASVELVDTNIGTSRTLSVSMSTPRANHGALLLADNNQVILIGGETAGIPASSVEIYTPWTSELRPTGALKTARASATASNLAVPGRAIVAGGELSSTEIYAFATVKTDRTDYLPDMPVNITGTGWVPGENVHVNIVNNGISRMSVDLVANGWGNISDSTFAPVGADLGETFYLTATGSQSQAQTKFTDGTMTVTVTGPGTVTGSVPLSPANCTSSSSCSVTATSEVLTASGNYVNTWTGNNKITVTAGCTAGSSTCSFNIASGNSATMAVAFAPAPAVSSISPITAAYGYAGNVTVTGTGFINGTTKIVFGGTQLATSCSGATSCSATVPSRGTGSYAVSVTNGTAANSATRNFTITQNAATVTLSNLTATYDGSSHAATVTTVPSGLAASVTYGGSTTAPTNAGTYLVVATITDPNYTGSANGTLTISKASATITLGNLNQTYDGSGKSATAATSPSGLSTSFTYDGGLALPISAGDYAVVATIADPNYVGSATGTLTITGATATVSLSNLTAIYNGTAHAATATTIPAGLTVDITYGGSAVAPTNAGDYAVIATIADANYSGSTTGTLSINKAPATVSITNLSQTYDGSAKPVTITTAPSALATTITYGGDPTAPANAGNYPIVATINDANYSGTATDTLTINPATATVVLGNLTATYDGTAKSVSVTTTPGGLTTSITYSGSASAPSNAGTYAIVATANGPNHSGSANGSLTIGKADQTITFGTLNSMNVTDVPFTVTATSSSSLPVSFSASGNCSVAGSTVTITNVGNCSITASQPGGANFNAATPVTQSFAIGGGVPVIDWATPQAIAYGTPISAGQLNAAASYGGTSLTGTFDYSPAAGTVLAAGTHTLSATFHPTDSSYTSASGTVQVTVLPATVVITAPSLARSYGDANPTATPSYGAFVNGESSAVLGTPATCSSLATAASRVGTYPITCSGASAANYQFSYTPGVLTVTAVPLSVTPNNASRPQGQANPSFTGTITGIRNSDPITATYSSTATASSAVGTYPITAALSDGGSGVLANYTATVNTGTLTVLNNKPDLIEAVSVPPATLISGGPITVVDTVTNVGGTGARSSTTNFYLQSGSKRVAALGGRFADVLSPGAISGPVSTTLTLPTNISGTYSVMACADDYTVVAESNESNNCTQSSSFAVGGADLVVRSIVAPTSGVSGSMVSVTDTTANQGPAGARSTTTIFYLVSGSTRIASLGSRSVDVLNSGATSGPASTNLTLPANINGTYSVMACADDYAVVAESNESNNCLQSSTFPVSGADLVTRNISVPASAVSGSNITVTETTANQGAAGARATISRFYLASGSTRVAILGSRDVEALASGAASGPVITTIALPAKLVGTYTVLVCADDYTVVAEASETNNCSSSASLLVTK